MGFSFTLIASRSGLEPPRQLTRITEVGGWTLYKPSKRYLQPADLEDLTIRLAKDREGPALGCWVQDSDWGYVAFALPEGVLGRVFVNPDAAEDYAEGQAALSLAQDETDEAEERLAVWSQFTPRQVSSETIKALVKRHTSFAEEPLFAIFEALGITVPQDRLWVQP